MVIMTTNHPETLDPALIRPGRVDCRVKFEKSRGKVLQATVLPHPQNAAKNSGAGFVRYGTEEDAANVTEYAKHCF